MVNSLKKHWAQVFVAITLLTGQGFHIYRVFVSPERFLEVISPTVDSIFAIPMIIGLVGMVITWKYIAFRNRWEKFWAGFTVVYFLISIPLHVQTWFTGSIEFVTRIPLWFSVVFVLYTMPLLILWIRVRIQEPQHRNQTTAVSMKG